MTPVPLDTRPKKTGRYSGRTVLKAKNPFEPSSRLLLAAYRGSVSDFAVALDALITPVLDMEAVLL